MRESRPADAMINPHVSVDCVVLGFDGEHIKVLLVGQIRCDEGAEGHYLKLPGSLIYDDEDLDEESDDFISSTILSLCSTTAVCCKYFIASETNALL